MLGQNQTISEFTSQATTFVSEHPVLSSLIVAVIALVVYVNLPKATRAKIASYLRFSQDDEETPQPAAKQVAISVPHVDSKPIAPVAQPLKPIDVDNSAKSDPTQNVDALVSHLRGVYVDLDESDELSGDIEQAIDYLKTKLKPLITVSLKA